MNDPDADAHILSGVAKGDDAGWRRWTADRFSLVCKSLPAGSWRVRLNFEVFDRFINELGPFTVTVSVNGQPLQTRTFSQPGDVELAADVPAGLIEPGKDARIDVSADKVWISPTDGARLALRLIAAGFVSQ
jgi:hypothetical protein